jgi:hypothetical protein
VGARTYLHGFLLGLLRVRVEGRELGLHRHRGELGLQPAELVLRRGIAEQVRRISTKNVVSAARGSRVARGVQLVLVVEERVCVRVLDGPAPALFLLLAELDRGLEVAFLGRAALAARLLVRGPLALLDRALQLVVAARAPPRRRGRTLAPPRRVLVLRAALLVVVRAAEHAVAHRRARAALLPEARLVQQQVRDVLGLLAHVCALVLAELVDVLELAQRLDDVDVVPEVDDDVLRAGV